MAGASAITGIQVAAVRALAAGADLLCLGSETSAERYEGILDAIVAAVARGRPAAGAAARCRMPHRGTGRRLPAGGPRRDRAGTGRRGHHRGLRGLRRRP